MEPLTEQEEEFAGETDDGVNYPRTILGQTVKVERQRDGRTGLRISCNNPDHKNCDKYRSVNKDVARFGRRAAEFYLIAWLLESAKDRDWHKKYQPKWPEVQQIADTY